GQRSVRLNWRKGLVLNAFGLSGPGFRALLDSGRWQQLRRPFFLSFMAIEESPNASLLEVRSFVQTLKKALPNFAAPVGLQVNFSCPNVQHLEHVSVFRTHLDEYQALDIPVIAKISATLSMD